jgi:hypothetical protein
VVFFCRAFELTTTLVVTCNVVLFGIDYRGIPEGLSNQLERINYAFIAFYCFEQTLKIAAFSHAYFFPYRCAFFGAPIAMMVIF